jgi:hypothetical protein
MGETRGWGQAKGGCFYPGRFFVASDLKKGKSFASLAWTLAPEGPSRRRLTLGKAALPGKYLYFLKLDLNCLENLTRKAVFPQSA